MKKILMSLLLLAGLAAFSEVKAQCTSNLTNNSNCSVDIMLVYDDGSNLIYASNILAAGATTSVTYNPCVGILKVVITDQSNFLGGTINTIGGSVPYTDCSGSSVTATWQLNGDVDIL